MSLTAITRARASTLLFGGAALCTTVSTSQAQASATIRIATQPIENAAEVFYAKDMGFFAKAGIDVDIQPMLSSSAIGAAVASSSVDIGFITIDTLANIHQKGVPLVVIAPAAEYVSAATARINALLLPETSPVQQARDLNGKTIAVAALHSLAELAPRAWIDQNGGDSSTVKFVEIPFPAMPAALDEGRIDAAWVTEPFMTVAKKNARILVYGFDAIAKRFLIATWVTMPQWATSHSDVVRRFAAVIHETASWASQNPEKCSAILARYTKLDPSTLATMTHSVYAASLTASAMQPLIDASAKYNGFKSFPAQELIFTASP